MYKRDVTSRANGEDEANLDLAEDLLYALRGRLHGVQVRSDRFEELRSIQCHLHPTKMRGRRQVDTSKRIFTPHSSKAPLSNKDERTT